MLLTSLFKSTVTVLALTAACCFAQLKNDVPVIMQIQPVDSDMIVLEIHARQVHPGGQKPYVAQPQDKIVKWHEMTWINRDGRDFAALVGKDQKIIYECATVTGKLLDVQWVTDPHHFQIRVQTPTGGSTLIEPTHVYRKSEPLDFVRTALHHYDSSMLHHLYVQLPTSLVEGAVYTVTIKDHTPAITPVTYEYKPRQQQSEAVHVTQVGFKPGDPKAGYVSLWMGDGGGHGYQVSRPFELLNEATGKSVYQGKLALSKAASDKTEDFSKQNYNGTDVYIADFSDYKQPGQYRLYVDGIGCSDNFTIAPDVWLKPFITAARGLYHQRSGIELGQPYTDFKRPRPHHPADGVKIYQSNLMYMDPDAQNSQTSRFKDLVERSTGKTTDQAWGGYMDAGDWDRRIDHLAVSHLLFELIESYPDKLAKVKLNIPESGNDLPDLLDEALFNLDFYRRMQRADGAVSGGVEEEEHPRYGEASWQDSLRLFQFAPGPYATFTYAACAAHASMTLEKYDSVLAKTYLDSALKAMQWTQAQMTDARYAKLGNVVSDAQNLAALMLYSKTHDETWHELFKTTSVFKTKQWHVAKWLKFDQTDAAYYYLAMPREMTDAALRKNVEQALITTANRLVDAGRVTAFGWTGDPGAGVGWGKLTVPQALNLLRAYRLTGEQKYYRTTVHATQFGTGANPSNLCYTSGVGHHWPRAVLNVDALHTNQTAPKGITVMGPMDVNKLKGYWVLKFSEPYIYPNWQSWPTTEAFWEIPISARTNEYTVHKTLGPNIYVWGCLAGMD